MEPIRVLIIQPNHLLRDALAFYIESLRTRLEVVASVAEAKDITGNMLQLRPDVVLIDLGLPGREGLYEARQVHRLFGQARILMTGVTDLESDVLACIEAGAAGCLSKEASLGDMRKSIEAAAIGEALVSPKIAGRLFDRIRQNADQRERIRTLDLVRLTQREREVIAYIEKGLSNKEIAVQLHIEVQTVKNHVHNILEKLQLGGRREAVRYAIEHGLIAPMG